MSMSRTVTINFINYSQASEPVVTFNPDLAWFTYMFSTPEAVTRYYAQANDSLYKLQSLYCDI